MELKTVEGIYRIYTVHAYVYAWTGNRPEVYILTWTIIQPENMYLQVHVAKTHVIVRTPG